MATDKRRIALWAYHHCERENAMWVGTDPMNICPMRGACPGCQEKAIDALNQVARKRTVAETGPTCRETNHDQDRCYGGGDYAG